LPTTTAEHHTELLALAADVEKINHTMKELETLESLLLAGQKDEVSGKSIELRQSIKKLMTAPAFLESLNRLEVNGQPIWGLSTDEREMITLAREKVTKV
jgi:glutamine amidotransferase PdxT